MAINMKAIRTFAGTEGFLKRGDSFLVKNEQRAKILTDLKLAKKEEKEPNPDNVQLIKPVEGPEILPLNQSSITKPFDDAVHFLGGGWYELPNGERVQGKETARDVYEAYTKERGDTYG